MREYKNLNSMPEFVLTIDLKIRGIRLALRFLDHHWACIINMHVHRRSVSRRDSFAPTLFTEEYTLRVQCTVGGLDQRFILGNQIGNAP